MLLDRAKADDSLHSILENLIGGGEECDKYLPEVVSSNLTPLMVAAIGDNLEITRLFLEKGYKIENPHHPRCSCKELCAKEAGTDETLTKSMNRLNCYRVLSSPVYLILTSEDPILAAFELSRDFKCFAAELTENCEEYLNLGQQCSMFATALIDQCRSTEEVKTVLAQRNGFTDQGPHRFPRLKLAVRYEQKAFVTHSNCQRALRSLWIEGLPTWQTWSFDRRCLHVMKHAILSPVICFLYIFVPRANMISSLNVPLNRFIYFTASYLAFLSCLMFTLLSEKYYKYPPAVFTELAVGLYVVGLFVDLFCQYRFVRFNKDMLSWIKYHILELTQVLFFLISQTMSLMGVLGYVKSPDDDSVSSRDSPSLVGEAFYAMASVMAFSRLLLWCHINCRLGPLIVSLKYMIGDVLRFFVLFFIMMFAFSIGINSIYKNFKCDSGECNAFFTLRQTIKNLFWAIFGKGEVNLVNIPITHHNNSVASHSSYIISETVGYTLWGVYHLITCLILLNMLIGMMAESYQRVLKNADLEWKFGRSTLYLKFCDCYCVVPPPFNLIPSIAFIINHYRWAKNAIFGKKDGEETEKVEWSIKSGCHWIPDENTVKKEKEKYEKLLMHLTRRYLHSENQTIPSLGKSMRTKNGYTTK